MPVDLQSTGAAPSNVDVGEAGEPHPLARIFRSMTLDSASLNGARDRPLDFAQDRPFDSAQDVQDSLSIPPHRGKRHDRL
jgi:hypothetical protein